MKYRDFGDSGWKVSALGFGCMRFPVTDGKPYSSKIDRPEATRMVRRAIDSGVNYIDTAYPYHGEKSEPLLGQILRHGYRERVKLVTKSPIWLIKKPKDFDKYLDQQLERLKTDAIDFYLFHGLNRKSWEGVVRKHGLVKNAKAAIRDGRIGGIGFSFHDDFPVFKKIIDSYDDWCLCQIQYNYMDTENQAGTKGLKYAGSKGIPVVIMEPLLGGKLAVPPKPVKDIFRDDGRNKVPADLALQWLWDQPEVSVVLSGMSTMRQVTGNLRSADASGIGTLGKEDRELIRRIKRKFREMAPIPCTKCGYCMPCPNGVDIPENFELYNDGVVHSDLRGSRRAYTNFMDKGSRASKCKKCGKCIPKCPQKIPIMELMREIHAVLGEDKRPKKHALG